MKHRLKNVNWIYVAILYGAFMMAGIYEVVSREDASWWRLIGITACFLVGIAMAMWKEYFWK